MANYCVNAKPFEFKFDLEHTALLIIDMQRDFCYRGGFGESLGNDVTPTNAIIPTVEKILQAARKAGMFVIHTREGHRPDLTDCPPAKKARSSSIGTVGPMGRILIRGEYGHDIVDELKPQEGEPVIDKPGKDAFYMTDLELILHNREIRSLIVCGVTTHVCVHTTIRAANDRGFECLMMEDGTAAFDPADQEAAIRMINQQGGIFGWTTTSDELLKVLP
ncbi:MAG: cysteine hydrolase [Erysipelotrichales bacterium]|nr:cysteine hydrolase [Erysipelotrichales bacterium]MBQ1386021.1 cysteine hydrolase [Erysipelotrichales bacterium]MBQ2309993.1 cysteine hydrolase [Erysipelotrichales bacterium]MBQ2478118.1 cysteine hydrolase [Erysipelotrichales bacterium]MBQ4011230.1 cysteine hydrolase [Erysipelotrichales bacterium]